jgi:hypothetical protein
MQTNEILLFTVILLSIIVLALSLAILTITNIFKAIKKALSTTSKPIGKSDYASVVSFLEFSIEYAKKARDKAND